MKLTTVACAAVMTVTLLLIGCSGEENEAKRLGFSSVQEMNDAHTKGWHTKERLEEDAAIKAGYKSVAEMKTILAKKKEKEKPNQTEAPALTTTQAPVVATPSAEMKAAIANKSEQKSSSQTSQPSALLASISRCAASAFLIATLHQRNNQKEEENGMAHAALAYAKTTIDIGMAEGLSQEAVVEINKAIKTSVLNEFKQTSDIQQWSSGEQKVCLNTLRANHDAMEFFGEHFRE